MLRAAGELLLRLQSRDFLSRRKLPRQFNKTVSRSATFFIILPAQQPDVTHAVAAVRQLTTQYGKQATVLVKHEHLQLLEHMPGTSIEEYFATDIGKMGLPKQQLRKRLHQQQYDAVLDFERAESLFSCSCAMAVRATLYCGFKKKLADRFYELQFDDTDKPADERYKDFLHYLTML